MKKTIDFFSLEKCCGPHAARAVATPDLDVFKQVQNLQNFHFSVYFSIFKKISNIRTPFSAMKKTATALKFYRHVYKVLN